MLQTDEDLSKLIDNLSIDTSLTSKNENCTNENEDKTKGESSKTNSNQSSPEINKNDEEHIKQMHLDKIRNWMNHRFTIEMTDGRVLVGIFVCTDKDANIILASCAEYTSQAWNATHDENGPQESRLLGLVMIPGHHIISILLDDHIQ